MSLYSCSTKAETKKSMMSIIQLEFSIRNWFLTLFEAKAIQTILLINGPINFHMIYRSITVHIRSIEMPYYVHYIWNDDGNNKPCAKGTMTQVKKSHACLRNNV